MEEEEPLGQRYAGVREGPGHDLHLLPMLAVESGADANAPALCWVIPHRAYDYVWYETILGIDDDDPQLCETCVVLARRAATKRRLTQERLADLPWNKRDV